MAAGFMNETNLLWEHFFFLTPGCPLLSASSQGLGVDVRVTENRGEIALEVGGGGTYSATFWK